MMRIGRERCHLSLQKLAPCHPLCSWSDKSSVIAVPAVGADPESTWKTRDEILRRNGKNYKNYGLGHPGRDDRGENWLESIILKEIPIAHILYYDHGYLGEHDNIKALATRLLDTIPSESVSSTSSDARPRPLAFICHSTGGLVVKQALVLAAKKDANGNRKLKYDRILKSCIAITFIGIRCACHVVVSLANIGSCTASGL